MDSLFYLKEALKEAQKAFEMDEVPVGAILVREGQILSKSHNFRETLQSPISHAEIHALMKAAQREGSWRLDQCTLYVTLEPCLMCISAMSQARIKKCIYGAEDKKGGALSLGYFIHEDTRLNHRFEVEYLKVEECGNILTKFFKNKRKK